MVHAADKLLPVSGLFSEKMKSFTEGRRGTFDLLQRSLGKSESTIWFHAASLGEYEQAVPVIREARKIFPGHKIIVSFFSPSGYEVRKSDSLADLTIYLPLDTPENAKLFLDLVHPDWAIFIKYEFWPNFLSELQRRKTKTLLVSGIFRTDQPFFKTYGKWMRKYLLAFEHFFLQDENSKKLLSDIGFHNTTVSGDTRFDRVHAQLLLDNHLDFIESFKGDDLCVVAGSTWPEDEDLLVDYINNHSKNTRFILAPHTIRPSRIQALQDRLDEAVLLYSERADKSPKDYRVLIVNTIGLLSRIYSYSDIAYVGGAAGDTGLHNILEPAAFGVPVVIGKNYAKFPEASELKKYGGLFSVADPAALEQLLERLIMNKDLRKKHGLLSKKFVEERRGATSSIINYLSEY